LAFFEFLSSFFVPTAESIVFGNKNNDDGQDFREFTGDCLFTSVSFTVNTDYAAAFLSMNSKSSKPNLHNLSLYKTIISLTSLE
jgi:hypothetical protein